MKVICRTEEQEKYCKERNYDNYKNKKNDPDRIEMKKYCSRCQKHTVHKETK